ncbi:MAG: right-handed parallel beta-helix repeat-containing protein [Rikenellaceae bacterium]
MKKLLSLSVVVFALWSCSNQSTIFLDANTTSSTQNGSADHPYQNLSQAYEQMSEKKSDHCVELIFSAGTYYFDRGFLFDERFSNVTLKSQPNQRVVFSGGRSLPVETQLQADGVTHKLDLSAVQGVYLGELHNTGFSRPFLNTWVELFVNGEPMHLSRWPNEGMIPLGKVLDAGSNPRQGDFSKRDGVFKYDSTRISSWEFNDDMWISGYFHYGFADDALRIKSLDKERQEITTDGPTLYSFASGSPWQRYYFYNIREEVDQKGEYFVDRPNLAVYFIPQHDQITSLVLSQLDQVMFDVYQAQNVVFEGITFEHSRAAFISMVETQNCTIRNCEFSNSGSLAVIVGLGISPFKDFLHEGTGESVRGMVGNLSQHIYSNNTFNRQAGRNNTIEDCTFYNLGTGAVSLGGGDRLTLEEGNNQVIGSTFHDNNRIEKSYRPHIDLMGVGNKIIGCELYNCSSMAILMHGNNHLVENNYLHDICLEADDQGAFYYGRNPSECGTVIRGNLFANIPIGSFGTSAVYCDDGACGIIVDSNIFYSTGHRSVLLGGGSDNTYTNNLFINTPCGIYVDNRLENWSSGLIATDGIFEVRLKEVAYDQYPYDSVYPYMSDYIPNKARPQRNLSQGNIFTGINHQYEGDSSWITKKDDYRLSDSITLSAYSLESLREAISANDTISSFTQIIDRL